MNRISVEQAAMQLVETIKLSEPYREYQKAYDQLSQNKEKMEILNKVRRAYFEASFETDPAALQTSLVRLAETYSDVLDKKWVVDFMEKEQRYCNLIRSVQERMDEVLAFDMTFLTTQD